MYDLLSAETVKEMTREYYKNKLLEIYPELFNDIVKAAEKGNNSLVIEEYNLPNDERTKRLNDLRGIANLLISLGYKVKVIDGFYDSWGDFVGKNELTLTITW